VSDSIKALRMMANPTRRQVVNCIVEEAIRLTSSKIGYFALLNEAEDELKMLGWSKSAMNACAMIDKPIIYPLEQTGLWGDCVRERGPVIVNDYAESTRVTKKGYPPGHVELIRHMNVPMHGGGRLAGILGVGNKDADYTDADAAALQKLADDVWRIVRNRI
jgi:GAF domain-containing protein